jgi:predicted ester cyclase
MRALVEGYAAAKSRADTDTALSLCHPRFTIDTVAFGIRSRDRAETAVHLGAFFSAFPDYGVTVDDMAIGEDSVACWGTARLTLSGEGFGLAPTGKRAEVPFFCAFTFAEGLLASEVFFFDLAAFCDGIGVPLPLMRQTLEHLRAAQDGVIAGG